MDKLLTALQNMPEYRDFVAGIRKGKNGALSGIGQINRSHFIAGLQKDCKRPIVIICSDDSAAKRLQNELKDSL
jgi:hypothetical protein